MPTDPLQRSLFELSDPVPERPALAPPAPSPPAKCQVPATPKLKLAVAGADLNAFTSTLDRLLPGGLARVTLTANRSRFLSARPAKERLARERSPWILRLHWGFALAPEDVLEAVATYLRARGERRREALALLRDYFSAFADSGPTPPRRRRSPVLRPRGEHHDLEAIRDEVDRRYFGGRLDVAITWGRAPSRRRQRTIHLGTYDHRRRLIRIHLRLDHPRVPRLVVASVVHHELLHAAMPAETVRGRRRIHPPEFRRRDRQFEGYDEAEAWIKDNLPWLLRGGKP